jgi:hypothetical protein
MATIKPLYHTYFIKFKGSTHPLRNVCKESTKNFGNFNSEIGFDRIQCMTVIQRQAQTLELSGYFDVEIKLN